jgi:Fic family protein
MPRQISKYQLSAISDIVRLYPNGAAIRDLLESPALSIPKRTLQRHLEHLVSEDRLEAKGVGRARRYLFLESSTSVREDTPSVSRGSDWLSPEADRIRESILRPLAQRTPVGYRGAFLDAYHPNKTFYLPSSMRSDLARLGQVSFEELPPGTYVRQFLHRLLIDLSWNSSRLEGNTYSLLETERLIECGEGAEGKPPEETQMILNHKAAIEMLAEQADGIAFNRHTVCNIHALLSDNLLPNPASCGLIRTRPVGISGTVFHPLAVPQMIEENFDAILQKAQSIQDPFEQAFFVMVHLPYLQPFEDVNKRVSRLAANIPLIRRNLCPLSFIDVEQKDYIGGLLGIYELNRYEYLRDVFDFAYRRSCARYSAVRQSLGTPDPFRLKYRASISETVREIVQKKMSKSVALAFSNQVAAEKIPKSEWKKFVETIEMELSGIHPGNIVRHRLRLSELEIWKTIWQ